MSHRTLLARRLVAVGGSASFAAASIAHCESSKPHRALNEPSELTQRWFAKVADLPPRNAAVKAFKSFHDWAAYLQDGSRGLLSAAALHRCIPTRNPDPYSLLQQEDDTRLKNLMAWRWCDADDSAVDSSAEGYEEVKGRARMSVLLEIEESLGAGDWLIVHGAYPSALLKDIAGSVALAETEAQRLPGVPKMSSMNRSHARSLVGGRSYHCSARVETVKRRVGAETPTWDLCLHAEIVDAQGAVCVKAKAQFVVETFTTEALKELDSHPAILPDEMPRKSSAGWLGWFVPAE